MRITPTRKTVAPSVEHMTGANAAAVIITVAIALTTAGCSSSSTSTPSVTQLTYTGVGASDAVGVGAVPCATAGTPAIVTPASCPGGNGYVPVLATLLTNATTQVTLVDLGISGAVIGPDIQADTAACFGAPGNFITNELPLVNAKSGLVTIFAGGNDTNAIVACAAAIAQGGGNPTAFINAEIAKFGADYAALVQGIKTASPGTLIVVANLPNFKLIPVGQTQPAGVQALLDQVSLAIDQTVINPSAGVSVSAVVDTLCNPSSYVVSNFSADGFHPSAAGYALFAQEYDTAVLAARAGTAIKPAASCPPYTLAVVRKPLTATDVMQMHLWRY